PDAPSVFCYAGHINQVFMNVLTNAAQAIRGEGSIDIAIEPVHKSGVVPPSAARGGGAAGGGGARVTGTESGPGVPEHIRAHIFDPFFTTKEVGEGTGLGLTISESIVHSHGGLIYLEEQGPGATFVIELPVRPPTRPPKTEAT